VRKFLSFAKQVVSSAKSTEITIYAPMIFAAPCEMFLMGANRLRGPYSGVGPENRELLGP